MKKIFVALFWMVAMGAFGQIFTSVSVSKLVGNQTGDVRLAGISPQGDYVLTTTGSNKGLTRVFVSSGKSEHLTDAVGAGITPVISADGKKIIYRDVRYTEDRLRQTSLRMIDAENSTGKIIQEPARGIKSYGFHQNTAFVMKDNGETTQGGTKLLATETGGKERISVFLEDLQLRLEVDGKKISLAPNGTDVNYIWPSLSPDGTKILYYVSERGAYVCDLDGTNVRFIAYDCRAPQWYDDHVIVGMDDDDDGERLISSRIVAYTLDGKSQALTEGASLTMFPFCSAEKGIVACSTGNGEIYLIHLTR